MGEQNNLAVTEPQRAKAMLAELNCWREAVAARMPKPNPSEAKATELGKRTCQPQPEK